MSTKYTRAFTKVHFGYAVKLSGGSSLWKEADDLHSQKNWGCSSCSKRWNSCKNCVTIHRAGRLNWSANLGSIPTRFDTVFQQGARTKRTQRNIRRLWKKKIWLFLPLSAGDHGFGQRSRQTWSMATVCWTSISPRPLLLDHLFPFFYFPAKLERCAMVELNHFLISRRKYLPLFPSISCIFREAHIRKSVQFFYFFGSNFRRKRYISFFPWSWLPRGNLTSPETGRQFMDRRQIVAIWNVVPFWSFDGRRIQEEEQPLPQISSNQTAVFLCEKRNRNAGNTGAWMIELER